MKILILPLLLFPLLAGAQPAQLPQPYQSPATVAMRLKAQCAAVSPPQRPDCEKKARTEVRASIDRHHAMKRAEAQKPPAKKPAVKPAAKAPAAGERKGTQIIVPPSPPQK